MVTDDKHGCIVDAKFLGYMAPGAMMSSTSNRAGGNECARIPPSRIFSPSIKGAEFAETRVA
jgi:hypothetical protein